MEERPVIYLYEWRGFKGMSQDELARRAHVARQTVAVIESGKTKRPRGLTVRALAQALDIEVKQLYTKPPGY